MRIGDHAAFFYAWFQRDGLRRAVHLVFILAVEPLWMRLACAGWRSYARTRHVLRLLTADRQLRRWRARRAEILAAARDCPKTQIADLGLEPDRMGEVQARLDRGHEVVLGDFDRDSFLLTHVGQIPEFACVGLDEYVPRPESRYRVQLVARSGWVGVKKTFRDKKLRFLNELHALHTLGAAGCRVPRILDVDFKRLAITTTLLRGDNLRERLARESAVVRDRDVAVDPAFQGLSARQVYEKRIENGVAVLHRVVDQRFVDELFRQLQIIHGAKIIWSDFHYGNIVIQRDSGLPALLDFDPSVDAHRMNRYVLRLLCDQDLEKFNKHFGRREWTYGRVRDLCRGPAGTPLESLYAPVYLGCGLRLGPIWSLAAGFGRWNYILKDNLPACAGKRILDLGSNNAFNAIQLLRQGAREVVALELDEKPIRQGELLRELFEWADRGPLNLRYVHGSMTALERMDLGRFDMVLSLCSLYHLPSEADMRQVARSVGRLTDTFVIQANHTPREPREKQRRARVEFLEELLKDSGFEDTRVVSYSGYTHPLIIGRKRAAAVLPGPHWLGIGSETATERRREAA